MTDSTFKTTPRPGLDLVYVPTQQHWTALARVAPELRDNARIASASLDLLARLDADRRQSLDLSSFIDGAAVEAHHRRAWRLSRQWAKLYWCEVRMGGIDLHEVARNHMFLPFAAALNAELIWRRVIDAVRPARVVLFEPAGTPVHLIQHFETDVPAAVLAFVAERADIEIAWLARPADLAPRTSIEGARPGAAAGWLGPSPGRQVLALGGGRDHRDQRRLVEALAGCEGIGVCHVDAGRADALYGSPPGLPWQALLALADGPDALARAIEDGWRRFRDGVARRDAEPAVLFANPHLGFQFEYYRDTLVELSRVIAATDLALDTQQPSGLLLSNDNDTLRGAVYAARRRGIPSMALVHGGIAYFQVYDFATDAMIVWGRAQADELVRFGRPAARIVRGGNYNDAAPALSAEVIDQRRRQLLDEIDMPRASRVVVLITAQPNNELTVLRTDLSRHRMAWRALARYAHRRRDVAFVIKPHPVHDDPRFYAGLASEGARPFHVLDGRRNLLDLLPLCDAAVLVSAPSTAALEAMLCGKPVAYVRSACYTVDGYRTALDREGAVVIDDLAQLEATLDTIVDETPARRAAIAAAGAFVERFLDATGEAALRTTARLVIDRLGAPVPAPDGSAAWRTAMAAAVGDLLASGDAAVFARRITAAAAAWPERAPDPDRLAGLVVGWVVASRYRPPGASLPRTVAAVFAALPEPLRPSSGIRRRWMARLHAVLAFDAARAGRPRSAMRHRWAVRGWRVGARIGVRSGTARRTAPAFAAGAGADHPAVAVEPPGDGGIAMTEVPR